MSTETVTIHYIEPEGHDCEIAAVCTIMPPQRGNFYGEPAGRYEAEPGYATLTQCLLNGKPWDGVLSAAEVKSVEIRAYERWSCDGENEDE